MNKKISYLARSFDDIKSELLNFSKKYYPELSDNFNDASVGAWMLDMVSAVGDDLAYHTDRMYQETNINSANSRSSILNNARMNGIKIPGAKSSLCEVELSCTVGIKDNSPNVEELPVLKMGGTVGNSSYTFELTEDVNFAEQFNKDGFSNRKIVPTRDNNGIITGYTITKNTIVVGGQSKIYKKVILEDDLKPFMEIVLPEQNIMSVESIIFKETSNFTNDPQMYEFFVDDEEFKVKNEDITTYRYFEVDSLSDQYRFGTEMYYDSNSDDSNTVKYPPLQEVCITYGEEINSEEDNSAMNGNRTVNIRNYYQGKWKPIVQKFITEYTDNNYLKIIFGCATDIVETPINTSKYAENIMSKMVNNKMLGILPKAGWTMYVLYRVGGGTETNLAQGAINKLLNVDIVFNEGSNLPPSGKTSVIKSLSVYNPTTSIAGKDAPSTEELKYLVKYSIPTQDRCVTLKDYKAKILQIPPKYGCPFRCNAMEENNKIIIPMLGLNYNGKLDSTLPEILVNNVKEWLSNYKNLTDYIEMRSGKIYNLGFDVDVFVDKNYTTQDVIASIINKVYDYMDVNKRDMGDDIFIGDLEREINNLDGVIGLIGMRIYTIYGQNYNDKCPLPIKTNESDCCKTDVVEFAVSGGNAEQLDIEAVDGVLVSDYDSMFEIKNKESDIRVRVKLR